MTTTKLRLAFIFTLIAFASGFVALNEVADEATPILVSTEWLAEHLDDENLVLLHMGNEYDEGHIPGARLISFDMISRTDEGLRLQMLPLAELDANLERLGISDDSRIIIYPGSTWATATARVYLTLDYVGLGSQTSILDGGMQAWKAENRPVTTDVPPATTGDFTPRPNPELIATADWLGENLQNPKVAVIDARTEDYYTGWQGGHAQPRAGHIAGAHNIPFSSIVDDETMKLKGIDELRAMFDAAGVKPGDKVVTYCHIGQQASLVYVAAKYLGYDAAMYDGSFQEWSNLDQLPVERPAAEWLPAPISTERLAALIGTEEVSIVDMRSDFVAYLKGHIPGAGYAHYETLRATKAGVPADLLPAESYETLFAELGIDMDRPVVIYSAGDRVNFNATFLSWILAGFGHRSIYVLDGGYSKWAAESRPTSRDLPEIEATSFAADDFSPSRATLDWVKWTVDNAGTPRGDEMILVDVRPTDQYEGQAGAQARRGHIPGAINHVWSSDLTSDGDHKLWKPVDELRASYEAQGITRDKHVILYCNTGTEASHVYFALKSLLEYPTVDVYFPSWTEWSAREDLPVETGPGPRGLRAEG